MNNEDMNFVDFIKKYNIRIPIIQRDYVQGRKNEKYIRESFIDAIFNSLKLSEKLNLEFIYGNIFEDEKNNKVFEPIDGQQRLTTLYLVTLFLALKENRIEDLERIKEKTFTYEIRNSSIEFCKDLKNNLTYIPENIKEFIINEKWYDEDWNSDQTVQSMLEMLQCIQDKYNEEPREELFNKLEQYVNFKFINTQDQNLDEDTYIKLNARGVKLSSFEKYKASFLKFDNFRENYSKKIDSIWNDWIWKKINVNDYRENNAIFDKAFTGIFRAILTNEYAYRHKIINYKNDTANDILEKLINDENIDFSTYKELMEDDIENILIELGRIFDFFTLNNDIIFKKDFNKYIDLNDIINKELIEVNKDNENTSNRLKGNIERCEFYAICLFAKKYSNVPFNTDDYIQWTRIARNCIPRVISSNAEYTIITNKIYDLYNLISKTDNYLENLSKLSLDIDADIAVERIFNNKINQEVIKSKVMLIDNRWKKLVELNDENKYLAGETNFLLDFCGITSKLEHSENYEKEECLKKYTDYTNIKNIIFPNNEERICEILDKRFDSEDNQCDNSHKLLTRALFAISEWNDIYCLSEDEKERIDKEYGYLLKMKNSHYTFLSNTDERDYSWRNLFKEENKTNCIYFKILMNDLIEQNVDTQEKMIVRLKQIIDDCKVESWKKYFIKDDTIFYLMNNRLNLIKVENFNENKYNIFLLNGKADSCKSIPLFFIALEKKTKDRNMNITSNGEKIIDAWTVGLYYRLQHKKRIDRINDKECKIYMNRDENSDYIRYYKDLSNLSDFEKEIVNSALSEIEREFNIYFMED